MGYIASSDTITVTARLTPYGRKKLLTSSNSEFVSYFALGDSDANYQTSQTLTTGEVPSISGDLSYVSGLTNSVYSDITIKNKLIRNSIGDLYKPVGSGSFEVNETKQYLGFRTITGDTIEQNVISRVDYTTDPLVNLFSTFGLPILSTDIVKYNTYSTINGGYSNTTFSGLTSQDVLVVSIPNDQYGELIDGKTINLNITTSADTYSCYSTFQKTLTTNIGIQDSNIKETANTVSIGDNTVFIFSDQIKRPNGNISKSWSTGYGTPKPYSVGGKELFNYIDNVGLSYNVDTMVGIGYLDKGFIVITEPSIVSGFTSTDASATTLTFNTLTTDVSQSIVCDALVSEFRKSTNKTFTNGVDTVRLTEVGLYDSDYKLVAISKLSQPHLLNNMYFRIEVKITV